MSRVVLLSTNPVLERALVRACLPAGNDEWDGGLQQTYMVYMAAHNVRASAEIEVG